MRGADSQRATLPRVGHPARCRSVGTACREWWSGCRRPPAKPPAPSRPPLGLPAPLSPSSSPSPTPSSPPSPPRRLRHRLCRRPHRQSHCQPCCLLCRQRHCQPYHQLRLASCTGSHAVSDADHAVSGTQQRCGKGKSGGGVRDWRWRRLSHLLQRHRLNQHHIVHHHRQLLPHCWAICWPVAISWPVDIASGSTSAVCHDRHCTFDSTAHMPPAARSAAPSTASSAASSASPSVHRTDDRAVRSPHHRPCCQPTAHRQPCCQLRRRPHCRQRRQRLYQPCRRLRRQRCC